MRKKMEKNGTKARTWDQVVLQEAFTEIRVMLIIDSGRGTQGGVRSRDPIISHAESYYPYKTPTTIYPSLLP